MPRRRLGVALLVPDPWAHEIDGLRRACGDQQFDRIAPHVTLVPPVNVSGGAIGEALRLLRVSAAALAPAGELILTLGPPQTFLPDSATVYLRVSGAPTAVETLGRLRAGVFTGPFARPVDRPFVPHVTVANSINERRSAAALTALADFEIEVGFERLHLLEERRDDQGLRRWVPIADAPFARPAIVGRGGIELELTTSELIDPEAEALAVAPPAVESSLPLGADPLVVTARRRGSAVGVIHGWIREDEHEVVGWVVVENQQKMGIGRQLWLAFAAQVEARRHDDGR